VNRASILLLALFAASCGGNVGEVGIQIGTAAHALSCHVAGLQAKLLVGGALPDAGVIDCPLQVNSDDTVQGTCPAIPTGSVDEFRLLYFVELDPSQPPPQELDLAQASVMVDLRNFGAKNLDISYPPNSIDTSSFDDNMDGVSNLMSVCTGQNPRAKH
jgi:hypothetical protein